MQLIITQNPEAEPSNEVLPVSYPKFTSMIQKGDTIFIGRYLVTGSEDSSLYVKVHRALDRMLLLFPTAKCAALCNEKSSLLCGGHTLPR